MSEYQAPLKEMMFVMKELAGLDSIAALPSFEDASPDVVEAVLEQAARLANEVFSPLNHSGDEQGTFIEHDKVVSPAGFADAYRQFAESGWQSIHQPVEYDGQGLPYLVHCAVAEMWYSSNMALALCPLLTSGAIEAIYSHATDELKQLYLRKMIAAEWSGTMNLTEPQAGTDLAAVKTKAVPEGDFYRISGQKIYITWGEHELSQNIIHLVLARLPGAPEGVKGISLFLVPKYLVNDDGSLGERNDLKVVSVESKLGIHASPTCVMSYGDKAGAIGYLIGEENNGLACMFTMMNNARHEVGMQGVGISERAYQRALEFAQQRIQGFAHGEEGRVTIIHHPDVRRMLMQMRAITEAGRAFGYVTSAEIDLAHHAVSAQDRAHHLSRRDLYIPIIKAWCTEMAQEVSYLGVQIHGGMGFIEETGAAQHMRDARILTIYEGTTGIQALDLMGRKTLRDKGRAMAELIAEMRQFGEQIAGNSELLRIAQRFSHALDSLEDVSKWYLDNVAADPYLAGSVGVNYLMLAGNVIGGWLMGRSAVAAQQRIAAGEDDLFYRNKIKTAVFFAEHILTRSDSLRASVEAGSQSVMSIAVDSFEAG